MRSTQAEMEKRVREVLALRLQGGELHDLVQYSSEQGWNVGVRMLQKYIAHTDRIIERSLEKDRAKILNRHILQRRSLFAKAISVSDYATAKGILKDEAELLGLYPAKRTELTGANGGPLQTETVVMTDEQINAAMLAVLASVGQADHRTPGGPQAESDGLPVGGSFAGDEQGGIDPGPLAEGVAPLDL